MAEEVGNIFQLLLDNLQVLHNQLEGGEGARKQSSGFKLQDFWLKLGEATGIVSHEVTKLCLAFSKGPVPGPVDTQVLVNSIETSCLTMVSAFYGLPKEQGVVLRKEVRKGMIKIVDALTTVVKSVKEKGQSGHKDRLKMTAWVWEACEAVNGLPRDNLQAACKILQKEEMLVVDALQEIEEEMKSDRVAQEGHFEVDNSETWNNMDRELLPPCMGLVKTARACLKKIGAAVRKNGNCDTEDRIAQLDDLVTEVSTLSPSVDDFITSVYPPMRRELVKKEALVVVNRIQKLLLRVQNSHYVTDEDQTWVQFLLKAVDHNNNKLQPLLTPEPTALSD